MRFAPVLSHSDRDSQRDRERHHFDCTEAANQALRRIMERVEIPDRLAEDLVLLIRQNDGKLAQRRRTKEFAALTDAEVVAIEEIVQEAFEGFAANGPME